jgi:hypothetical protein
VLRDHEFVCVNEPHKYSLIVVDTIEKVKDGSEWMHDECREGVEEAGGVYVEEVKDGSVWMHDEYNEGVTGGVYIHFKSTMNSDCYGVHRGS